MLQGIHLGLEILFAQFVSVRHFFVNSYKSVKHVAVVSVGAFLVFSFFLSFAFFALHVADLSVVEVFFDFCLLFAVVLFYLLLSEVVLGIAQFGEVLVAGFVEGLLLLNLALNLCVHFVFEFIGSLLFLQFLSLTGIENLLEVNSLLEFLLFEFLLLLQVLFLEPE